MKHILRVSAVVSLLGVVLPVVAADPPKKESPPVKLSKQEQAILDLINRARETEGVTPLAAHAILMDLARGHSANMAKQGKLSHELDGKKASDRMKEAGYSPGDSGENIAAGPVLDARGAFDGWMKSPPHRANILNKQFRDFGIGLERATNGRMYYTAVFGVSERGAQPEPKDAAIEEARTRLFRLVNAAREKEKQPGLTFNAKLSAAARVHAGNMAKSGKLEHTLEGKTGADRIKEAGYTADYGGQLLGWSARLQAQDTFDAWTADRDQRKRMFSSGVKEIGIGIVRDGKGEFYYCLVFGTGEKTAAEDEKFFKEAAQKILELTNAARKKEGLVELSANTMLADIARTHSANMAKQDKMEHILDGKAPKDRVLTGGYDYSYVGENLAVTDGDPSEVIFKFWLESKVHREQLLNPNFREMGMGLVRDGKGRIWYTQLFGTQRKKK